MRDIHKGAIFLMLGLLASVVTLSMDDRRWEMAFINWDEKQDLDVQNIQSQLLAGLDPTLNAQATAAGNPSTTQKSIAENVVSNKKSAFCFSGKIARDINSDQFHEMPYISVKEDQDTFISIDNNFALLLKSAFEVQSASLIQSLPSSVAHTMQLAIENGRCIELDLHLAKIKS
jgi:hypothetical protein